MLELAVVLGIIALIAGAGISMATGAISAADRVTTRERLDTIKLALDSFGKTYGYLPCPAPRNVTPRDAGFGVAAPTCNVAGAGFEVDTGTPVTIAIGAVPVRTLGLPDTYAGDAWGDKMSYAVTIVLTTDPTAYATQDGAIDVRYGVRSSNVTRTTKSVRDSYTTASTVALGTKTKLDGLSSTSDFCLGCTVQVSGNSNIYKGPFTISTKGPTSITINTSFNGSESGNVELRETGPGAAYIVISHGADGRGAYPMSGTSVPPKKLCNNSATADTSPAPCTDSTSDRCIDIENCQTGIATEKLDTIFFDTTYNDGTVTTYYFDDYVVWGENARYRAPVYTNLYTSTSNQCPTNVCEPWCAACGHSYPGNSSTVPPGSPLASATGLVLCKKVVYSNRSDCTASCFWSGKASNDYYPCP